MEFKFAILGACSLSFKSQFKGNGTELLLLESLWKILKSFLSNSKVSSILILSKKWFSFIFKLMFVSFNSFLLKKSKLDISIKLSFNSLLKEYSYSELKYVEGALFWDCIFILLIKLFFCFSD